MSSFTPENGNQGSGSSSAAAATSSSNSKSTHSKFNAMDFSGIGVDIIKLEEGLRQLHQNQTVSYLEKLEGVESNTDEINFKRLTKLLRQVSLLYPILF